MDADLSWVMDMNLHCPEILKPDLCIFLDISPAVGEERLSSDRSHREIYENVATQQRVRKRFLEVFDLLKDNENIKIVDAARSVEAVSADIIKICEALKEK